MKKNCINRVKEFSICEQIAQRSDYLRRLAHSLLGCNPSSCLYPRHLARIMQPPEPGIPSVEPLSISPRDPSPDPDASIKWLQDIFTRRAARFKAMYGN